PGVDASWRQDYDDLSTARIIETDMSPCARGSPEGRHSLTKSIPQRYTRRASRRVACCPRVSVETSPSRGERTRPAGDVWSPSLAGTHPVSRSQGQVKRGLSNEIELMPLALKL